MLSYGQLAQLAEQRTLNPWVQGSIPWLPIIYRHWTVAVFLYKK